MKTFKLISIDILEKSGDELEYIEVDMMDGLIIDREIEQDRWLIECFIPVKYLKYFKQKQSEDREFVVQVRISKAANPKATIVAKVNSINEIEDDINVILIGNLVNREREQIEQMLQDLIEAGYQGASLLKRFKEKNQESFF
ncbi:YwpF family protein [Aquisalibacillus elongatus]|uniref:YwpF-like protein n=1 Tax=Aquisalibacillus elongatus TaxID=485577 RepID=A0A3N5BYN2_9BACI|nr:YwpF family protein [Aquisalibacillus elongatus]RPF52272.1 YwpF-like protein [Aquisalibacillus elongatus]